MFKILSKNKKGVSFAELIITITLLGFIISIAGQLLLSFTRVYNIAARRWEIQSAVHLACNKFEKSRDSISNAYKADLLYDTAIDAGVVYNTETKQITWNQASKVMPTEGVKDDKNIYTYIFSVPAKDQNGKDLGSFLFIRDFDSERSVLFLDNEGMGEVPVNISFRVASSPDLLDSNTLQPKDEQSHRYLTSTVEIDFTSGVEDVTNYELITQFTLNNFSGRALTMEGSHPVLEQAWVGNAYPAGWSQGAGVDGMPSTKVNYITKREPLVFCDDSLAVDCTTYMTGDANMMRFVSERAADSKGNVDDLSSNVQMASCLTKFLFIDGTVEGARVDGALREFRDNVLKGNAVGDWVIDKYYNSWSPALVNYCQDHTWAANAMKTVIKPVSKVLGLFASV